MKTIKDISILLNDVKDEDDQLLKMCMKDKRVGVQKLVRKWIKRNEEKQLEVNTFLNMMQYEKVLKQKGIKAIAGIDEVGRGPLAGPVVAAAVILPDGFYLGGLNDSKKLSAHRRQQFYEYINNHAYAVGIGIVNEREIDELNIYEATKIAMLEAVANLKHEADYLLIDAMTLQTSIPQMSIIKGDGLPRLAGGARRSTGGRPPAPTCAPISRSSVPVTRARRSRSGWPRSGRSIGGPLAGLAAGDPWGAHRHATPATSSAARPRGRAGRAAAAPWWTDDSRRATGGGDPRRSSVAARARPARSGAVETAYAAGLRIASWRQPELGRRSTCGAARSG